MNKITEKDLFKFIFYPHELDKNKFEFITNNKEKFENEISFLEDLNSEINKPVPDNVFENILNKIKTEKEKKEIILVKELPISNSASEHFTLAAASSENPKSKTSETYKDSTNTYLAKVIESTNEKKLFIFSKDDLENQRIKLTLFPSEKDYSVSSREFPILLSKNENIDKIVLSVI